MIAIDAEDLIIHASERVLERLHTHCWDRIGEIDRQYRMSHYGHTPEYKLIEAIRIEFERREWMFGPDMR